MRTIEKTAYMCKAGSSRRGTFGRRGPPTTRSSLAWRSSGTTTAITHPWFSGAGNDPLTFTAPAPEDLLSTGPRKNYLEIRLTATDSVGLSTTRRQVLRPQTVDVTFATQPTEFKLEVNGIAFRSPRTFRSWEGYKLNVYAPRQRHDDRTRVFLSWSDGRRARHTITTASTPTTYTAKFERLRR